MTALVVVGAGAAGLVAAIAAAERQPGADILLIERTSDGGRKILISGGGRCNILPSTLAPERFVTDSPPQLLRRLLRAWPLADQRRFFEQQVGIPLALEEASGKLFPVSNRAQDVRNGLMELATRVGVRVQGQTALTGLAPVENGWRLATSRGDIMARTVVLATGGLSVPATGSDGGGIQLARQLGHVIHETYPALTPLLAEGSTHGSLSGVSGPVRLRAKWRGKTIEANGGFLFTHHGYSGPSVLDVSHVAVRSRLNGDKPEHRAVLRVAWTARSADDWESDLASGRAGLVVKLVARHVPPRLAEALLTDANVLATRKLAELRRDERKRLIDSLTSFVLPWTSDEGYKKAEVTGGGVALDEVDPRTLESKRHRGLFFCGEMLDAFGPIGGHNFAWAWSTGRAAGHGTSEFLISNS